MPTRRVKESERRRCARACGNCKRRKEKCDGNRPCHRCQVRGATSQCRPSGIPLVASSLPSPVPDSRESHSDHRQLQDAFPQSPDLPVPQVSRLIKDEKGEFMYLGDAASLSFLQNIRRIVRSTVGHCTFVDDPLRHFMVETCADGQRDTIVSCATNPPPRLSKQDAANLMEWYTCAIDSVLHLFDRNELDVEIAEWTSAPDKTPDGKSALYHLIMALGAQASPEDWDEAAGRHFNYGRFLTLVTLTENPSIPTIQAHVLIAMYLLAASRRNAAFMCLGLAVRAAYAIGLHRQDVSALYPASECVTRERLWTATRTLDLFTSSCLGRPPSTSETRDMSAKQTYSATNDLNLIFETILTQVYAKRMISTETLEKISDHHRRWAARFTGGLEVDGISPDVKSTPNLGLLNMKQSYYWSIMLVSQPFLIERATSHAALFGQSGPPRQGALSNLHRNDLLAHACVDSAIQSINLLRPLMNGAPTPKRLPMVINSIFASSLVLGLALFANLDQSFPLMQSLEAAKDALRLFSQHDAMTRRHLDIVESLSVACQTYSDTWTRQRMEGYHQRINGVFGSVHPSTAPTGGAAFPSQEQSYHGTTYGQSQAAAQGDTSNESFEPPQDSENANVFASLEGGEQEFLSRALSDISPKTLWFDAFDVSMSLLPTVDPSTLGLE